MFNKLLLTDTAGKKSSTLTAFVVGFLVVNAKLILSGITIQGITISPFTGSEYAMAIGSLGAIYVLRRSSRKSNESNDN